MRHGSSLFAECTDASVYIAGATSHIAVFGCERRTQTHIYIRRIQKYSHIFNWKTFGRTNSTSKNALLWRQSLAFQERPFSFLRVHVAHSNAGAARERQNAIHQIPFYTISHQAICCRSAFAPNKCIQRTAKVIYNWV